MAITSKKTPLKTNMKAIVSTMVQSKAKTTQEAAPKKAVAKKVSVKKTTPKKTTPKKTVTKKTMTARTTKSPIKKAVPEKPAVKEAAATLETRSEMHPEAIEVMPKHVKTVTATMILALGLKPYKEKSGEEYMSVDMFEHFSLYLLAWKQKLMKDVDSTVSHMQEELSNHPDPLDMASQEQDFRLELRTRDRERQLIKKIEMSLDDIKEGEYGFCEDCGAEIGVRRLEARPTATKCIDCKTFQEIREKQVGI